MRDNEFLKQVGMEVRIARMRRRMKIEELAKITKLSTMCLYRIEEGKSDCHVLNLKSIAEALEVPLKDFLVPL